VCSHDAHDVLQHDEDAGDVSNVQVFAPGDLLRLWNIVGEGVGEVKSVGDDKSKEQQLEGEAAYDDIADRCFLS